MTERGAMVVIYDHPRDYPEQFVARRFWMGGWLEGSRTEVELAPLAVVDTLDEARRAVPVNMLNIGRNPKDDPRIAEVWVSSVWVSVLQGIVERADAALRAAKEELQDRADRATPDNPGYDGTDAAHPAWWRGEAHGTQMAALALRRVAEEPVPRPHYFADPEMQAAALAIHTVMAERQHLAHVLAGATAGEAEPAAHEALLVGLEAQALEHGQGDIARELRALMAKRRADALALEALRRDVLRGLRVAHELTLDTQSVEAACASLVELVRSARKVTP